MFGRFKFVIGGALIIAAIVYLIVSSTQASAQYYLTVEELQAKQSSMTGKDIRISGAVLGDTIQYDPATLSLSFSVVHVPADTKEVERLGGLAQVLHDATLNPDLPRLEVVYIGVMPDLLKNEAQAIMTGKLREDGKFEASELLLKCPTKYEEAVPEQSGG